MAAVLNEINNQLFRRLEKCKKDSPEYLAIRDEIFQKNQRMLTIATRSYNNGNYFDFQDFRAEAAIGLLRAIETFKVDKGNSFYTYSLVCMKSYINMYLRKHKRHSEKNVSMETVIASCGGDDLVLEEVLGTTEVEEDCIKNVSIDEIKKLLPKLSQKEREVITLRYLDENDMTQTQITKQVGISRSYVSRLEGQAIKQLQKMLTGDEEEG